MAYAEIEPETAVRAVTPSDEQAKMLESRCNEADEQIAKARAQIAAWEPVAASCRAGLEVLNAPRPEPSY
jgi:hypothetical protein